MLSYWSSKRYFEIALISELKKDPSRFKFQLENLAEHISETFVRSC